MTHTPASQALPDLVRFAVRPDAVVVPAAPPTGHLDTQERGEAAAVDPEFHAEPLADLAGLEPAIPALALGASDSATGHDVIEFDPSSGLSDPSLQRVWRLEFAQATPAVAAADATAAGSVLSLAPYQLAAGGLALGLAVGGLAGGGGNSGSQENFVWSGGNLNIVTPGGTVVTVDASGGAGGGSLILSGASSVNVNGVSGSRVINATSLSGNLAVSMIDDGAAGSLSLSAGSGALSIVSADSKDSLVIDASALPSAGSITLSGRVLDARVSALSGSFNASGLDAGSLTISTAPTAAGQQRSLTVQTGAGATQVNGSLGDTIIIDAEKLADEVLLRTSGAANFTISNLLGNLENTASGKVIATLDNDSESGVRLTTSIRSTSAITVNNGALDINDTIILEGTGPFTVNGLLAKLDAGKATGVTTVTAAPFVSTDSIIIVTGSGATTVSGSAAGSRISIDAGKIPDNTALTLRDSGSFTVTGLQGDVIASQALGAITISTANAGGQGVQVTLGVAGGQVNAAGPTTIDALAMANGSTLTIGRPPVAGTASGSVTVTGMSGKLDNQGTGETLVNLLKANGAAATTVVVSSDSMVNVANGSLTGTDTIKLAGAGVFGVTGLAANLDGAAVSGTLGEITATLASDGALSILLSPAGRDTVVLNGRNSTASMIEVEKLNVQAGGSISGAAITADAVALSPGQIAGTQIDFADQTATLGVSVAQHTAMRSGNLIIATQADSGVQTLALSTGGDIGQTIPHIDAYQLSSAGPTFAVTIKSQPITVNNDIQQQFALSSTQTSSALTIKGSSGNDVIRTAAADLIRGGLEIDLGADSKTDYLFVNNSRIGNEGFQGDNATNGLGGRVKGYSSGPTAYYANGASIDATVAIWKQLVATPVSQSGPYSAGVQAVNIRGFQPTNDAVVYLEQTQEAKIGGYISLSSVPGAGGFAPLTNSVIELESGFVTSSGSNFAAVGSDPKDLEKIAMLLARVPAFNDGGVGKGFYVVVYDYAKGAAADAWLYSATATQNDGFDFADDPDQAKPRDTDTLELIAIFKGVGVNAFTTDNFV